MKTLHLAILIITGIFLPMLGLMPMLPAQATTQYAPSSSFGMSGNASGQFPFLPTNIAINNTGFIFVTETENDRVQIFDSSGNWKQVIAGEHHKSNCSMEGCNVISYDSTNGHFYAPTSIAINSTGFIFVADAANNRVQIFDSSGNWKKSFGEAGNASGQFYLPTGIAINNNGFIFVADTTNHHIQIFRPMQIVPEFPFAVPVFLVSIASLIAFYRIRKI